MHVMTDAASTLGGRFNLIFDPHDGCLYQHAFGAFRERPLDLVIGIKTPQGEIWALPFTSSGSAFPYVEQFSTLTTIEYRAVHPDLWVELRVRIRAPFYPRNVGISTAPLYYVDIEVRNPDRFRWERPEAPLCAGELVFALSGDAVEFQPADDGFRYAFDSTGQSRHYDRTVTTRVETWCECPEADTLGEGGLSMPFDLTGGRTAAMTVVWSNWVKEPVLEVFGEKTAFKYLRVFDSRDEMCSWAREERPRIEARCDLLDQTVLDWSLGSAGAHMSALALHSFLVNSWWTTRKDGSDWFSVWEGSCFYHSTIDVEYNDAMLYMALWPELLEMLLDQWADFEVDGIETLGSAGRGTSFLCHDMGASHVVGRQAYEHNMEVEENVNYLLLLAAWTSFTGNVKKTKKKLALCRRLADFVVKADTNGNGVPELGVSNTIDDAGPAVQFGGEQVYLAVKTQAALWALAEMEQKCGAKDSQAERWRAFASKGIKTVEEEAWLGDHYAVSLSRTTEGLRDPWTGKELPPGELEGWDAYSIYAANGLLYLFLGGIKMPRWKLNRFADDALNACRATMTPYGCRHSTAGHTVWFSQNMWRDYVAAYLGVDMLDNVTRYWDYQAATGDNWRSSLYYDTTPQNNLNFYPRGTTVFGMAMSAAGLRLNRVDGELTLCPVRSTLRVPLLPLADWEGMRIPVLTVRRREGVTLLQLTERDLLKGLTITVLDGELEPE